MDDFRFTSCPNCGDLKNPRKPCGNCGGKSPPAARRVSDDTALAATEARIADLEMKLEIAERYTRKLIAANDRIAALEKALEPFALTGKMIPTDFSDFEVMTIYASAQHLRRAAALLKEKE